MISTKKIYCLVAATLGISAIVGAIAYLNREPEIKRLPEKLWTKYNLDEKKNKDLQVFFKDFSSSLKNSI